MNPIKPSHVLLPLQAGFYNRPTLDVAADLLGKHLIRLESDASLTVGIIQEVEAYIGQEDLGCHARSGLTPRNAAMWGPPGHAYVYFTYGMHWMLNAVTEQEGSPAAVLIRAIVPVLGVERMRERRNHKPDRILTDGPAKLCQTLDIDAAFNNLSLYDPQCTLTIRPGVEVDPAMIQRTPRIGLDNVPEPWRGIHWRFYVPLGAIHANQTRN